MSVSLDKIVIKVHIRLSEFIIIRRFIVCNFSWGLFLLKFHEVLIRNLLFDGRRDLRDLGFHIRDVLPRQLL